MVFSFRMADAQSAAPASAPVRPLVAASAPVRKRPGRGARTGMSASNRRGVASSP